MWCGTTEISNDFKGAWRFKSSRPDQSYYNKKSGLAKWLFRFFVDPAATKFGILCLWGGNFLI
jgi:hypothetical protein